MTQPALDFERMIAALKAAGDDTRLRLLMLLAHGELAVTELATVLGQSQPRVSRHLKLLGDAGLLDRHREGAWVFYRLAGSGAGAEIAAAILGLAPAHDPVFAADRARLQEVRAAHEAAAERYFQANATAWKRIRALHAPEADVEAEILSGLGEGELGAVIDLGTGTGRMLELLAPRARRAVGVDRSAEMLAIARAALERGALAQAQVRHGDVYRLAFPDGAGGEGFDLAIVHQVLHFLDEPQRALREAARVLNPGGRIVVADFAPHALEFLRAEHAHRRLGFADAEMREMLRAAGFEAITSTVLPPRKAGKLSVGVWRARRTRTAAARQEAAA